MKPSASQNLSINEGSYFDRIARPGRVTVVTATNTVARFNTPHVPAARHRPATPPAIAGGGSSSGELASELRLARGY